MSEPGLSRAEIRERVVAIVSTYSGTPASDIGNGVRIGGAFSELAYAIVIATGQVTVLNSEMTVDEVIASWLEKQ